ncbi:MAG: helix-turn-helix domain-containing protein [Verrucomicrobia bacterium]|nr:helix-turn-helix domain-containing protein [Verrucomicrobiota bacterium]
MSEVLTVEQACELLGLAKVTLYGYARQGVIPCFKLGRSWKFHRESLDNWMKERTEEETQARQAKRKRKVAA